MILSLLILGWICLAATAAGAATLAILNLQVAWETHSHLPKLTGAALLLTTTAMVYFGAQELTFWGLTLL
jgi:hypothetical protein